MFTFTHTKTELAIKAANPRLNFTMANYHVSAPIANDGRFPNLTENTLLRITPKFESAMSGSTVVSFSRISLDAIKNLTNGTVALPIELTTVHEAIPYFEKEYGLILQVEDFDDVAIDQLQNKITLTASPRSLTVHGECVLNVTVGPSNISSAITSTTLPAFSFYEDYVETAERYSDAWSATRHADFLKTVVPTTPIVALLPYVTALSGDVWSTKENSPFSLLGATITDVGSSPTHDRQIVVKLSAACTNLTGSLVFKFNLAGG